jgi:hypothetical protein
MDPLEVADVVQFGKSSKKAAAEMNLIGQYGNGLKSGSMRIGRDIILFTKKNGILSCVFISNTFFERENLNEIIVPLPSFTESSRSAWFDSSIDKNLAREKHKMEVDIILKHSPYNTREELMGQFDKITGVSGTLVVIYNLKLMDSGNTELDFKTDPTDIQMTDFKVDYDRKAQMEHKSFRAYTSILYLNPVMKIYIQNKKVNKLILN